MNLELGSIKIYLELFGTMNLELGSLKIYLELFGALNLELGSVKIYQLDRLEDRYMSNLSSRRRYIMQRSSKSVREFCFSQ